MSATKLGVRSFGRSIGKLFGLLGELVRGFFDGSLDVLSALLSVVAGIACMAFVAAKWILHLASLGSYWMAFVVAATALVLCAGAIVRIPLALFILFGGAVIVGTAFFGGYAQWLLP
jgi:hypothetical protein